MSSQITLPLSNDELRALDPRRSRGAWNPCRGMVAKEAKIDYGVEDLKQNMLRYFLYRWHTIWGTTLTGALAYTRIAKMLT